MIARRSAPWLRFFVADWIAWTRDLKATESGILINLIAHMHQRGEPIAEDHSRLARLCGCNARTFARTIGIFLNDGRIIRSDDGGLWSDLVQSEIDHRKNVSDKRSKNAEQRWGKSEQNHTEVDAIAYQSSESRAVEEKRSDFASLVATVGATGGGLCEAKESSPSGRRPPLDSSDLETDDFAIEKRRVVR
ncbi:DUF1376 domain-containing protein [Mesorhizobium sp. LNJC405B00]|uniref:DUF1376 domain-containing protein n=1 Tax=Mesorhizobium sp. LNJC405B00 TaxID=1287281 RepID=UPI0003CEC348|nr:DUF1376 domain-containing protein [Mesorhizobium sp. LNJC405B00]ESX87006.1 hypothetical protein X755_29590 [Mesorhizobium sp. LNJC405B00]